MTAALRRAMTVEEYLAWSTSQGQRARTELINGQIVTMPAERLLHSRVKGNVFLALRLAIKTARLPCEALTDGPTVRIDDHTAYEPDALVYCGEALAPDAMLIPNPVIVVEVLSPTTRHSDTSAKLIGYFKLPSVAHYLIVDPDDRTITHHTRDGVPEVRHDGTVRLDPPGLSVLVEDLFGE
jgi:Uma2 family endonuclease